MQVDNRRHKSRLHQNCKIDTARFKEGKRALTTRDRAKASRDAWMRCVLFDQDGKKKCLRGRKTKPTAAKPNNGQDAPSATHRGPSNCFLAKRTSGRSERPLRCGTLLHSVKKREDFSSDARALSHFGYSICRSALLGHSRSAEARHVNRSRSESQMGRRPHEGRSRSSPSDLSLSTRLELRGAG